jgi:hypothetical protein
MHDARVARLTCFVQFEALNCLMLCAQPRRPVLRTAARNCYAHSRKDLFYAYFRERFELHLCFQLMLCGFDVSTHDARDVRWRSIDTLCFDRIMLSLTNCYVFAHKLPCTCTLCSELLCAFNQLSCTCTCTLCSELLCAFNQLSCTCTLCFDFYQNDTRCSIALLLLGTDACD